ncbi:MBL fold metallo-hydrolase [Glaciecola sp. 1036]|uniref:MBL fold metallo-hydrolase n=1 Tax=Alteromonadaceae TaxID=72275 RepID=UPI003D001AC5
MKVQAFKAQGLAQLSYLVTSGNEGFIVDPQLDIQPYLKAARAENVRIKFVVETHRNEDFVSGAAALKSKLDIPVYHGRHSDESIDYADAVKQGDEFEVGELKVTVWETPGHTKDSVCYVVADTAISDESVVIFTGDTLFVNDVGRTDFYPDQEKEIAATLYDSLHELLKLPESTIVYPAHGAGSVCGGGMADREFSTLGYEKRHNPKLKIGDKDKFVEAKLAETHYYAPYFEKMEHYNARGKAEAIDERHLSQLDNQAWDDVISGKFACQLVDLRGQPAFCQSHIRGSLFLHGGMVSAYGGWFLNYDDPIVFVADSAEQAQSAAKQLWRMGYDNLHGYGSKVPVFTGNSNDKVRRLSLLTVDQFADENRSDQSLMLDVRKQDERDQSAIPGSKHIYLGFVPDNIDEIKQAERVTCLCASGVRATIAASYLLQQGVENVEVLQGSMQAWKASKG